MCLLFIMLLYGLPICYNYTINNSSQFPVCIMLLFICNSPSNTSDDFTHYRDSFLEVMDQIKD